MAAGADGIGAASAPPERAAVPEFRPWVNNYQFQNPRGLGRVALGALLLGSSLSASVAIVATSGWPWSQFALYTLALSVFHLLEFFLTAAYNPNTVSFDSYLINHSAAYQIALACGVSEFWLEVGLFDKARLWNVALGLAMMGCGQALRSLAMVTAGSNFTHQIAERRRAGHVLVTSGVYALCRHPSYAGWLLWCVGTQVFLGNPICSVGYFVVTWRFFRERIRVEEEYLVDFFGNAYSEYRRAVPFSGVPFVS